MSERVEVAAVEPVDPEHGFEVRFTFTNGEQRVIDLDPFLWGPVFEPIRNSREMFRAMRVDLGTITWPNEADICPDVLYLGLTPASWQDREAPAAGER